MYNAYFGFKEAPFSIAPDPRYLYMTAQHREALAHLVYGLNSEGGCILLTGEVGTGKTTVCRCLLEQIPEQSNIALVFNPKITAIELLESICDELKIDYPDTHNSVKTYIDRLNTFLIEANARGEKTVLIIDEAQNLDSSVLEQLRLLTNLETNQRKLLQIIILGQPELLEILSREEMRQLAQRITARFHLTSLSRDEVKAYISHRLAVAGQNVQLFPEGSTKRIYALSKGIPRLINVLCDRALLGTYVQNKPSVDTQTINKASKEVFGELKNTTHKTRPAFSWKSPWAVTSMIVTTAAFISILFFWQTQSPVTLPSDNSLSTGESQNIDALPGTIESDEPITTQAETEKNDVLALQSNISTNSAIAEKPGMDAIDNFIKTTSIDNQANAYSVLFKTWDHQYNKDTHGNACDYAQSEGLSCFHRYGNLNDLKQLNRPAVLRLFDSSGKSAFVIITRLTNSVATLNTGVEEFGIDINILNAHWFGEYTLLWKTPPYYYKAVQPGAQGPVVQWLDQQFVRLYGQNNEPAIRDTYSKELITQVKKFQQSKGLIPDGVAGPKTLIHLNSELGLLTPILKVDQS